jgi:NAD(P)-dependent dehydrogenase (short-subunit alcohol dehydrogenase family)
MLSKNDMFGLSGKVAVVSGAEGVLGKYFCDVLSRHGCTVAGIDKPSAIKLEGSKEYSDSNFSALIHKFPCDITDPKSVTDTISQIVSDLGPIDILVNNAATKTSSLAAFYASFEDYSLDTWQEVMSVNIDGMFLLSQAVGKVMIGNKIEGSIIQISSIYGLVAPHHDIYKNASYLGVKINSPAVYSASKAAVIGLSKYLATYWAEHNIRVNTLVPGGISSGQSTEFSKAYSELVPSNRMGTTKDLEAVLLLLASKESSFITGQNFIVDGGLSIW